MTRNKLGQFLKGYNGRIGKKDTKVTKEKMRQSHLNKSSPFKDRKHTEEAKQKNREKHLGKKSSEETKIKIRKWQINNPNRKFKDTSIELKVETELKKRNINYQKQVPLCKIAIVDFYLPEYRIVIQCDGNYWHNLPKQKERDERQDKVLTFNGFNIYRFWEHEINESVSKCLDEITFQFFN